MNAKTVILTGFTSGIGKEIARELAARGARLGLVCRDPRKGAAVREEIERSTGNRRLDILVADLSLMSSVRQLAGEILERYASIDVLINNAAAYSRSRVVTAEGLELNFATNHLAYYLLTRLLLERLRSSAAARIVNVTSAAYKRVPIDFDDLMSEKSYQPFDVYGKAKLGNIYLMQQLVARLGAEETLTVNCAHPGIVGTSIVREYGFLVSRLWRWFNRSPREGADNSIYLATDPALAGVSGQYFVGNSPEDLIPPGNDLEASRLLWERSAQICGLDPELD